MIAVAEKLQAEPKNKDTVLLFLEAFRCLPGVGPFSAGELKDKEILSFCLKNKYNLGGMIREEMNKDEEIALLYHNSDYFYSGCFNESLFPKTEKVKKAKSESYRRYGASMKGTW